MILPLFVNNYQSGSDLGDYEISSDGNLERKTHTITTVVVPSSSTNAVAAVASANGESNGESNHLGVHTRTPSHFHAHDHHHNLNHHETEKDPIRASLFAAFSVFRDALRVVRLVVVTIHLQTVLEGATRELTEKLHVDIQESEGSNSPQVEEDDPDPDSFQTAELPNLTLVVEDQESGGLNTQRSGT